MSFAGMTCSLYEKMTDFIDENLFLVDPLSGKILHANQKACKNLQYSYHELTQMSVEDIRRPMLDQEEGYWKRWDDHKRRLEENPKINSYGLLLRKDGNTFPVETSVNLIEHEGAQFVVAFVRDISTRIQDEGMRHQLEEALISCFEEEVSSRMSEHRRLENNERLMIQQSKMATMGEMIGAISHQMKQPLSVISLLVDAMADCAETHSHINQCMEDSKELLFQEIDQISQMIGSFGEFFKPSTHQEYFYLHRAIEDNIYLLSPIIKRYGIELNIDVDEKLLVQGYVTEFKELMTVLIANARESIIQNNKRYGKIEIKGYREGDSCVLTVCDNGGGIDSSCLPDKIFEPYMTTKANGSGVGLYIAKLIVQKMHGSLEAHNEDDMAVFRLTFPFSKPSF